MASAWEPDICGTSTNNAAPSATSMCVRTPAALPLCSRSNPRMPPSTAAISRRTVMRVSCEASPMSANSDCRVTQTSCHQAFMAHSLLKK
ncbi:hypothetical protein D3C76_1465740 [compost metagenome]